MSLQNVEEIIDKITHKKVLNYPRFYVLDWFCRVLSRRFSIQDFIEEN
jgi:hypothetical protein